MKAARYDIDVDEDNDFTTVHLGLIYTKYCNVQILHFATIQCEITFLHLHVLRYGYLVALQYVLRMKVGALLFCGLPCSLHVWISRGTSGKSRQHPRGRTDLPCVANANQIAARFGMIILVCLARQIWWLAEQPSSSVAHFLPYIQAGLYPAVRMLGFVGGVIQRMCFV